LRRLSIRPVTADPDNRMINRAQEFYYKLPGSPGGSRPGAHKSTSLGPGLSFAAHRRLFDQPDPRRLDLRASLRDVRREWLVRVNRQHSSVNIQVIVDVSASMHFGSHRSKMNIVGDFVQALGHSVFRYGDALGLMAFDYEARDDIYLPPRASRGAGLTMVDTLNSLDVSTARAGNLDGLAQCLSRVGNSALVFVVSDFHWPLDKLSSQINQLGTTQVIPIIVWDPSETQPPASGGWLSVTDTESGHRRNLWLRGSIRRQWEERVSQRRDELNTVFVNQNIQPFYVEGSFDAEALTQHFMENVS